MGFLKDSATDGLKAQELLLSGRVGSATVAGVRQTGTFVNDNPECELDLHVSVDGGEPYRVVHRQVLAIVALPGFQPGASVPVRVDPEDPLTLVIA
jgi:hypothetical protein